jgi:hypothetical protein
LLNDVEIAHSWAEYDRMNGNHADDGERENNENNSRCHRAAHRLRCVQAATPEAMTSRHEQGHCKSRIQITLPG